MMKFTSLLLLLLLSLSIRLSAQPAPSYTLQQSIETALANNLQVKQSGLRTKSAAVNLNQARANLLPDISANINHGTNQGRSIDPFTNGYVNQNVDYANYSLNSGIALFNGLIQRNLIKQNLLNYEAGKMEEQQTKDNIALNVTYTFFQILGNEEQLNQAKLQAEATQQQIDRLKILNKSGAIAPSQLSDLLGQFANDELSIINSRNALNASRIALAQLMNIPYTSQFTVERIPVDANVQSATESPDKVYALALEHLALVKGAIFRRKSAEKSIRIARGSRYPQLSLYGNVYSNYSSAAKTSQFISEQNVASGDYVDLNGAKLPVMVSQRSFENRKITYNDQIKNNYSSSVGIGLRIPILASLRSSSQISLAKIELNNAELTEETIRLELKQAVDLAWLNMVTARDRVETLNRQLTAFRASFSAAEARFNAGVGTAVDYTIAKNNLDRTTINLINARYELLLRVKVIDYYQGRLSF